MPFMRERAFARTFLAGVAADPDLQIEINHVIENAIGRYDTGPYENRFVVGGVVEQVVGSAARYLGMNVDNVGARNQGYDLQLASGEGLSIKYQSGLPSRATTFRLTNSQGGVGVWTRGTIFVVTGTGIGYADPDLTPGITRVAGDGKSLDLVLYPLLSFWGVTPRAQRGLPPPWLAGFPTFRADLRYFTVLNIPDRPTVRAPRLVSDPIAKDLMSSGHAPKLLSAHKDSI